jgi:hypothetical protein
MLQARVLTSEEIGAIPNISDIMGKALTSLIVSSEVII